MVYIVASIFIRVQNPQQSPEESTSTMPWKWFQEHNTMNATTIIPIPHLCPVLINQQDYLTPHHQSKRKSFKSKQGTSELKDESSKSSNPEKKNALIWDPKSAIWRIDRGSYT